jgi:hypothetical protein
MKRIISTSVLLLLLSFSTKAQFVTGAAPVQDGSVSASEYYSSSSSPWYMCWDDTYLYLALTGGQASEPGIVYFDFNANSAANGGAAIGTNGSTTGKNDYGSTPNLPFVSNARIFFTTNLNGSAGLYAEVNYNSGSGWGSPTTITSSLGSSSNTTRELKISWSQLRNGITSRPTSFNWLGTETSTGGYIYSQYPNANYSGNSSTTPTYYFYQSVVNTNSGTATNPFSSNFTSFTNYNTSFDYISSLPATLYNISIGKTSNSGTMNIKSDIIVKGDIAVKNGSIDVTGGVSKSISMSGSNQLIKIFNTSGGGITGTDNGVGNDLTLNVQTGTTTIDGDATTNNDHEKKFFNVSVSSGATLALSRGIMVRYGTFSVNGTLQINSNGYIQSGVANNKVASYSGANSTLIYANGGNYTSTDYEWPVTNAPTNVTIQTSGTNVILNNSKTIGGLLTLTIGKITTSSNTLSIGSSGSVTRTSGWIDGTLQRFFNTGSNISLTYDIGNSSNWMPVNISLGNVTVAGSITLNSTGTQHPNYATAGLNSSKYLSRYWTTTVSNATFSAAQVQFNYLSSDLQNGANELNLKAARFTGSAWAYPTLSGTSAYSFSISGLTNSTLTQSFTAGECAGDILLPTPTTNSPVCENTTLTLNGTAVSSGGIGAIGYAWSGANSFASSSLSSSINNITTSGAGAYTLTATDAIGCKATKSVLASVLQTSSSSTSISICSGDSYTFNGTTYNSAGTYTAHLTNAVGCDSVVTLVLSIKATSSSNNPVSICSTSLPYLWNGNSYNAAGTYTIHLTNSVGCDSAVTLVLSIRATSSSTTNATTCPSALPFLWNGNSYNTSGTYTVHLTNSVGCDSAATLVLSVQTTSTSTTNVTVCSASLPYSWNGTNYNSTGSYSKNFTNAVGCDSVATLNLTVTNTVPAITGSATLCVGSTIQLNNIISGGVWTSGSRASVNSTGLALGTSAGTATIKYSVTGCGSTTTSFIVNAKPAVPSINYAAGTTNPQLGAGGGLNFCANRTFSVVGTPTGGSWSSTGTASVNNSGVVNLGAINGAGSLTYTYTNPNGCSSSRTITGFVVTCASRGITYNEIEEANFSIFPNPAKTFVNIKSDMFVNNASIVITSITGKQVKTQLLSLGDNRIDVSNLSKGIYLLSLITKDERKTQKLIIE